MKTRNMISILTVISAFIGIGIALHGCQPNSPDNVEIPVQLTSMTMDAQNAWAQRYFDVFVARLRRHDYDAARSMLTPLVAGTMHDLLDSRGDAGSLQFLESQLPNLTRFHVCQNVQSRIAFCSGTGTVNETRIVRVFMQLQAGGVGVE